MAKRINMLFEADTVHQVRECLLTLKSRLVKRGGVLKMSGDEFSSVFRGLSFGTVAPVCAIEGFPVVVMKYFSRKGKVKLRIEMEANASFWGDV